MQGHQDSNHCTRTSSLKKEGQHLKTTYIDNTQIIVHTVQKTIVSLSLHSHIINLDHHSNLYHQFIQHQHLVPVQVAQDEIHNYFPCATTRSHLSPPPEPMCNSLSHKVDPNSLFKIVRFGFYLTSTKSKFPFFLAYFSLPNLTLKLACKFVSFFLKKKKKKKSIVRSWLPVGAFSTAHRTEPMYMYMGHTQICTQ